MLVPVDDKNILQASNPEPRAMPRPVQTVLDLALPLALAPGRAFADDDAALRRQLRAAHWQWCAANGVPLVTDDSPDAAGTNADPEGALSSEQTELDKLALRMFSVRRVVVVAWAMAW